jgi:hypothetical protein
VIRRVGQPVLNGGTASRATSGSGR